MATVPTPRSGSQILGDLFDGVLSRLGLTDLKPGSPALAFLESIAQSDLRGSQDIFQMLASIALDNAEKQALDRIGADLRAPRDPARASSGYTTWGDTSFAKISSRVYSGLAAPIVGSDKIYVEDATSFPASGSVYVSRGTERYEGPLAYSAKTQLGSYWRLNLTGVTQNFHLHGESVVLAQGGVRPINPGTVVRAPLGGAQAAIGFSTVFGATILDGEVQTANVLVVAQRPGTVGNTPRGGIKTIASSPFTGAVVTNTLPFSNGTDQESDDDYRERLREIVQTRSRGTPLALELGVRGVTSTDEQKRISSAVCVEGPTRATLYIDDGTGYEERSEGVEYEVLQESAIGGEQFFQVRAALPVTQAFIESSLQAPFVLQAGATLAIRVGGVLYQHSFSAAEFRAIGSATAYEVVSSINSNSALGFQARSSDNGTRVSLFSKEATNEDLELLAPASPVVDANQWFAFTESRVETVRLFKNDRLLSKDGQRAEVFSTQQSGWQAISGPHDLAVSVDGTPTQIYTFTDSDFSNLNTGYLTLASTNSLAAWAMVITSKIPGITVETGGGKLTLVSNLGRSSRAAVAITSAAGVNPSLVGSGQFFTALNGLTDTGRSRDYQMNRSTGKIYLEQALAAGDRLTIGTTAPRAFIESTSLGVVNLATAAHLWFVVDGAPTMVSTTLLPSQTVTISNIVTAPPSTWGKRLRITASAGTPFSAVQVGDWAILMDTNFPAWLNVAVRVARVSGTGDSFDFEVAALGGSYPPAPMSGGGIVFVRTRNLIQKVTVPAGATYTAATLSDALTVGLRGAVSTVWNTNRVRVQTLNGDASGSIALVAQDASAALIHLPASIVSNGSRQMAAASSGWNEDGTALLAPVGLASVAGQVATLNTAGVWSDLIAHWTKEQPDIDTFPAYLHRYGTNAHLMSTIEVRSGVAYTMREPFLAVPTTGSMLYFTMPPHFNGEDDFTAMIDGQYRFAMNMFRRAKPTTGTYGTVNDFTDSDNANASLAAAFGTTFRFADFAALMHARAKSHAEAGDTTKTILWRAKTWGKVGHTVKVRYAYPTAANAAVTVTPDAYVASEGQRTHAKVKLASGAARTGYLVRPTTKVGVVVVFPGPLKQVNYILGFPVQTATRAANVTTIDVTAALTALNATDHGLQVGDRIWFASTSGLYPSGVKVITTRAAATFTFADPGAAAGPTAACGTISFDSAGEALFVGSTIVVGDIVNWFNTPFTIPEYRQALRVSTLGDQYVKVLTEDLPATNTVVAWTQLGATTNFSAYPLNGTANIASAIATTVNSLGAGCPVTAVAVGAAGVATGVVSLASWEEFTTPSYGYTLSDGENFVRSHTTPPNTATNFTFTFKDAVTASLASNSDWANEDVRLVPRSAVNTRDFLNCLGVSGLSGVAETTMTESTRALQIASQRVGSGGTTQIQGGTANATATSVLSATTDVDSTLTFMVSTAGARGFGHGFVELINSVALPRPSIITSLTQLDSRGVNGNCTFSGTPAWVGTGAGGVATPSKNWRVEKHGHAVMYRWEGTDAVAPSFPAVAEGNYVLIYGTGTSTGNLGLFRVLGADDSAKIFWIENPDYVEEACTPTLLFLNENSSILPGDKLIVGSDIWGSSMQGTWTVESIDVGDQYSFKLAGTFAVLPAPVALGASSPFVKVYEGAPSKQIKLVVGMTPNGTAPTFTDMKVQPGGGSYWISSSAGTLMRAMDKLAFPSTLAVGFDAYRHSLGLIAESAKIVYGDRAAPVDFPGIAAANSVVDISGPVVRRLTLGFAVRLRTQYNPDDVIEAFRSAIAAEVNKNPIGAPLALSALIAAGTRVPGVEAITVTSPAFGVGHDLIQVQPQEKLLILNLEDIFVTLVGE